MMSFDSAVRILAERSCAGIRRKGWRRDNVLVQIGLELRFSTGLPFIPYVCDFIKDDWVLVLGVDVCRS